MSATRRLWRGRIGVQHDFQHHHPKFGRRQWLVMDPQGMVYTGTVDEMFRVLAQEHPLFKFPMKIDLGILK